MGIHVDPATLADWERRGLIQPPPLTPASQPEEPEEVGKPDLLPTIFTPPAVWQIGVETRSLANLRDWRRRNRLTIAARRAVSRAIGPCLHFLAPFAEVLHSERIAPSGRGVRCVLTRVAPRMLDASNLPTAMKPVEDALMLMMGADDGWSHWRPQWAQLVNPMMGVIIEMRIEG
jgi:hypothetical protein